MDKTKPQESKYWIYILSCENGSYYTGYTTNLIRRYREHMMRTDKCKYTRSFKPIKMIQSWQILGNKALAMKVEKYIKKMTKANKKQIIEHPEELKNIFPCIKES